MLETDKSKYITSTCPENEYMHIQYHLIGILFNNRNNNNENNNNNRNNNNENDNNENDNNANNNVNNNLNCDNYGLEDGKEEGGFHH